MRLGSTSRGIHGVIPLDPKVSVLPVRGIPGQGKTPGKSKETLDFLLLKVESGHVSGGTGTVTAVGSVRDAHAGR